MAGGERFPEPLPHPPGGDVAHPGGRAEQLGVRGIPGAMGGDNGAVHAVGGERGEKGETARGPLF
jgi:hypothetical protein